MLRGAAVGWLFPAEVAQMCGMVGRGCPFHSGNLACAGTTMKITRALEVFGSPVIAVHPYLTGETEACVLDE